MTINMQQNLLFQEFRSQTNCGIIKLIATAGKRKGVDCINLTHFCPHTGETPIYVFVCKEDVVILMLDWHHKGGRQISPVWQISEFTRQYKEAMSIAGIHLPDICSIIVTNRRIINYEEEQSGLGKMDVSVYHDIQMEQMPYVHYSVRFHAYACPQYIAFRQWCERQGYIPRDIYAFEDIDADYDEMEFCIDDDEDDQAFLDVYLSDIERTFR